MATTKGVISVDDESKWYQALFEEDCIVVMRLLDDYPSLLKVGWESEPSRRVEGRKRREGTGRTHSSWKGRTALHVGASRGCVKLIMKVLRRCNLDGFSEVNAAYERTLLPTLLDQTSDFTFPNSDGKGLETISATMELVGKTAGTPVVAKEKGAVTARSSLDAFNGRKVSVEMPAGMPAGDSETTESEGPWRGDSPHDHTIRQSDLQKVDERAQEASSSNSPSKGPAGKFKETVSTIISQLADDKRKVNAQQSVARMERQRTKKENNSDAISPDHVSEMDRRRLLLAKDGESGLDALAIAVLHGKEEVINLLRYYCIGMMAEVQTHHFKIAVGARETISMFDKIARQNREKRKLLRQVTVAVAMIYIDSGNLDSYEMYVKFLEDSENIDESIDESVDESTWESENDGPIAIDRKLYDEFRKVHDASSRFLLDKVKGESVFKDYFEHRDFNFLPPEEYLFHFLCSGDELYRKAVFQVNKWVSVGIMETLWMAVRSWSGDDYLWRFLLQELTDGQGRPPFHIANEDSNDFYVIKRLLLQSDNTEDTNAIIVAISAPDEAGRTPVQKAAALGRDNELSGFLGYAVDYEEIAATCHESWTSNTEDWGLSWAHNFPLRFPLAQTPLQAALINKNFSCAELLLEEWLKRKRWDSKLDMAFRSSDQLIFSPDNPAPWPQRVNYIAVLDLLGRIEDVKEWIEWDLLEFSCLVGAPLSFIEKLTGDLATPRLYDENKDRKEERRGQYTTVVVKHKWHALHLAASFGRYDLVKHFIGDLKWDPFIEDFEGNSALHYAMQIRKFDLPRHLLDYVNVEHYSKHNRASMAKGPISHATQIADRQGCINFLLQAGCDVFRPNKKIQVPYPIGSLKDSTEFLSWWYAKQEKEFTAAQNNFNFATNAISITATLVATASYVGPLQPPLGYDSNHIQYANGWVSTFIVCDTLSFYLAIVAITLSLIPSLPMPQQAMMEELQRTREMVIMAIGILLPSVFFVFIAFACSSISVMSANITSEVGGILVIVATVIGIVLCILAYILFSIRLLAFIFPKNNSIRYVYDLSFLTRYLKFFSKGLSRGRESIPTLQK